MPSIYAVGPDEKVAGGCHALEAIRILWSLANQPDNLLGARQLVKNGMLLSDRVKHPTNRLVPGQQSIGRVAVVSLSNPIEIAERQYARDHGSAALNDALHRLLDDVFPR